MVGDGGIVRACADDISFALRTISMLKLIFPVYQDIKHMPNLVIKPRTCVIIPTREEVNEELKVSIADWLKGEVPGWAGIAIQGRAKLLGVIIGPSAGQHQWTEAEAKLEKRTLEKPTFRN